jgi:hypothetical protein
VAETRIYSWSPPPRCPRTLPTLRYAPWRRRVAPRPPTGRVLGVTLSRPSHASAVSAGLPRADTGRHGRTLGPNLPAGELLGPPCLWEDTTGPGVAKDPASWVEWSVLLILRGLGRHPFARLRPGSRGPPGAKGFWRAWTACPAGAVIRKVRRKSFLAYVGISFVRLECRCGSRCWLRSVVV